MFCTKCGTESPNSAGEFCFKCGTKLIVDESSEDQEESPQAHDQLNTPEEPAPSLRSVSTTPSERRSSYKPLPGGYILGGGEEIERDEEYVFSIIHFWLKSHVVLTNRSLLWEKPNVKLGVFPLGRQTGNVPLAQIAGVNTNREFSIWKLLGGGILFLAALGNFANGVPLLGLILLIVGATLLSALFQTTLHIQHLGGPTTLTASVRQRIQVEALSTKLSQMIANLRK